MTHADESDFFAHSEAAYHRGKPPGLAAAEHLRNAACGDWVEVGVAVDAGGRIAGAYFDGQGCMVSQAAASLLGWGDVGRRGDL